MPPVPSTLIRPEPRPYTLLTNVHVVTSNASVTIRQANGSTAAARVAALSSDFDLAVLKIQNPSANQATIPLGSIATARVGQEVIAIGSALGVLQNTVTRGIVSGMRQIGTATLVQTDAALDLSFRSCCAPNRSPQH